MSATTYPPYSGHDTPKWDGESPKTWDEWTDPLDQVYRPGDYVAIATISGKSPQLVIGKVTKINRVDSKGHLIVSRTTRHVDCDKDEPGARERTKYDYTLKKSISLGQWYRIEHEFIPSCTVTAYPVLDGRGFGRYGKVKPTTYRLWGNIVKVDGSGLERALEALGDDLKALAEELGS